MTGFTKKKKKTCFVNGYREKIRHCGKRKKKLLKRWCAVDTCKSVRCKCNITGCSVKGKTSTSCRDYQQHWTTDKQKSKVFLWASAAKPQTKLALLNLFLHSFKNVCRCLTSDYVQYFVYQPKNNIAKLWHLVAVKYLANIRKHRIVPFQIRIARLQYLIRILNFQYSPTPKYFIDKCSRMLHKGNISNRWFICTQRFKMCGLVIGNWNS